MSSNSPSTQSNDQSDDQPQTSDGSTSAITGSPSDDGNTYAVKKTAQGQRFLEIPELHRSAAEFSIEDTVGLYAQNINGQLCFVLSSDTSRGVEQKIRRSQTRSGVGEITIPKRVAAGTQLTGTDVTFNSMKGCIIAVTNHTPRLSGELGVYDIETDMMSQWASNTYPFMIPTGITDTVTPGEDAWVWFDVFSDGFILVVDVDEENAPDGAARVSVREPEQQACDYLLRIPKRIGDVLEMDGKIIKWGHDKERIVGLVPMPAE